MGQVNHLRDFVFSYVTILEFPYKQIAYCQAGVWDVRDMSFRVTELLWQDPFQIMYNIIRKIGSISFSTLEFFDCFQSLDGRCAGINLGRIFFYFFDSFHPFSVVEILDEEHEFTVD